MLAKATTTIVKSQPIDNIVTFFNGGISSSTEQDNRINSLFHNTAPITLKNEYNRKNFLDRIMENVKSIPHIELPTLELNTDAFIAERIPIEKTDSKEIRTMITKINKKVACHTCDHTKFEKQKLDYMKDILELRNSKNLAIVYDYYKKSSSCCKCLVDIETNPRLIKKEEPFYLHFDQEAAFIEDSDKLKQAQKAAIDFATEA